MEPSLLRESVLGSFKAWKKLKNLSESIQELVEIDTRTCTDTDKIAVVLSETSDMRVTEQVIEDFKELIETKLYFPSDALIALRESSGLQHFDRIDYVLQDGSTILMTLDTNRKLNNLIKMDETASLLKHMLKNSECFISVVERLLEDTDGN